MKKESFNKDWLFVSKKSEIKKRVTLPHDAMQGEERRADCESGSAGAYYPGGVYEYEKHFTAPEQWAQQHIVFEFENTTVVSRLIEGEYFKIDQMLSSDYETKVEINKKELLDCIDRATLLIKEGDKKPIIINITDGSMELKINSTVGSMDEEIDISKVGKDLMIGFNPKFLIDALRVIDDETITIYLVNPKAPCFIRDEENNYIYLILPVNFTTV